MFLRILSWSLLYLHCYNCPYGWKKIEDFNINSNATICGVLGLFMTQLYNKYYDESCSKEIVGVSFVKKRYNNTKFPLLVYL